MKDACLRSVKQKVELVESQGFGEVTIKIKNGMVYRVLQTIDTIIESDLTNEQVKE